MNQGVRRAVACLPSLLLALLLASAPAQGGVYKCLVRGKAVYQDSPCATGGAVNLGPNSLPPVAADRDAAERRRKADLDAVAASRLAAEREEARERERQRLEAEQAARAAEEARRRQEACQAEAARLKALDRRASSSWKARHDLAKRLRKYRDKCGG